jgi:catechol 2,3-dioxygenase-like lactoylglutathione lyase family enzyme
VKFFADVLDCEEVLRMGESRADDDFMSTHLNVHPRTIIKEHRMLRCPSGGKISLMCYEAPDSESRMPKNSDPGGHHIAFRVVDMERAIGLLKEKGVKILAGPVTFSEGPNQGEAFIYFLTPWGLQLEFICYPRRA